MRCSTSSLPSALTTRAVQLRATPRFGFEQSLHEHHFLQRFQDAFCAGFVAKIGESSRPLAKQRFAFVKRLLFRSRCCGLFATIMHCRLLHKVLVAERQRSKVNNFEQLLGSATFMHSLWACAMEVVLYVYRVPWSAGEVGLGATGFPWILSVTQLTPYDFHKVRAVAAPQYCDDACRSLRSWCGPRPASALTCSGT